MTDYEGVIHPSAPRIKSFSSTKAILEGLQTFTNIRKLRPGRKEEERSEKPLRVSLKIHLHFFSPLPCRATSTTDGQAFFELSSTRT